MARSGDFHARESGAAPGGCLDVLVLPLALLAAWLCVVWVNLGRPCGGDGGSPYAEKGSPAAHFCSGGGQVALWLVPAVCAVVGLIVRIQRRGSASWPWVALAIGIAIDVTLGY